MTNNVNSCVTHYCKLLHVIQDNWLEKPYFGNGNYRKLRGKKVLFVNMALMIGKNNILDKEKTVSCE